MKTRHFLFVTLEAGGNVPPMLGLARRLSARGHRVTVLSEPCLGPAVTAMGLQFTPFERYFTRTDRQEDFFEDWKYGPLSNPTIDKIIFGPTQILVDETLRVIRRVQPEALVVDCLLPPALIAGEASGLPGAIIFHMPEYLPGPNRPPGMMGLLPGRNWLGQLRDRLLGRLFFAKIRKYLPRINAARLALGLAPLQHPVDLLNRAQRRLILTHPDFDFPLEPAPANVRYTGPVLDDPDWTEPGQLPGAASAERPLVVVSLSSTFQNQGATLQRCLDALGQLDLRGLVTVGPALDPGDFTAPENVTLVRSVPHSEVFPHADLVVTHAGHGTIMRALSYGLPLLCLPMGRDQYDNAAKVVYQGCGLQLSPQASVERLRKSIERLLTDTGFGARAAVFGAGIRELGQRNRGVDELEGMVAQPYTARATDAPQTV